MIRISPNPFGTLSVSRNECDDVGSDVLSSDEEVVFSSEDEIVEEDKVGVVVPVTAEAAAAEAAEGDEVVLLSVSAEAVGAAPASEDEICRAQTV